MRCVLRCVLLLVMWVVGGVCDGVCCVVCVVCVVWLRIVQCVLRWYCVGLVVMCVLGCVVMML